MPCANAVLPAPRSPTSRTRSPATNRPPSAAATARGLIGGIGAELHPDRAPPVVPTSSALHPDEVGAGLGQRLAARPQYGRRVEGREQRGVDAGAGERELAAAQLGDALLGVEQQLRREVAQRHDDARADQLELTVEPGCARLDLVGLRIAVARRAALHDVGDVHVVAREAHALDELGEELAGATDEGLALEVFLLARALADEQQVGVGTADAEHHLRPPRRELAQFAPGGDRLDCGERPARRVRRVPGCEERVG